MKIKIPEPIKQLHSVIKESYQANKDYYFPESYSPYCELCESCGEEGCCSPVSCMYKCMITEKPKKCNYGESYAHDLNFSYQLSNMYGEQIDLLESKEITVEEFLERVKLEWDLIYDKVYTIPKPEEI